MNLKEQMWFSLELVAITMGFVIVCGFFLFIPPMSLLMGGEDIAESLFPQLLNFVLLKWPLVMAAFGILFVIGILMSHRLWGPLYGLERAISAWRNGDRTARVRFRKYDYLIHSRDSLNGFFDAEEALFKRTEMLAKEIEDSAKAGAMNEVSSKAAELVAILSKKG